MGSQRASLIKHTPLEQRTQTHKDGEREKGFLRASQCDWRGAMLVAFCRDAGSANRIDRGVVRGRESTTPHTDVSSLISWTLAADQGTEEKGCKECLVLGRKNKRAAECRSLHTTRVSARLHENNTRNRVSSSHSQQLRSSIIQYKRWCSTL